jgi:hypothetical protein
MLLCAAFAKNHELKLRLTVPKDVAAQAARRAAGDAAAPAPVLMLHRLEFGANEGFKIEVLGESRSGAPLVTLAMTAVVGHPQRTPQPPLRKIDLPIPLNEAAAQLLANRSEVTIILRFRHIHPERPPVKIDSVFFASSTKE